MQTLKISQLKPDPGQPRQEFDPRDLELLKKSIASQGILQPLVVEKNGDGRYLIVDGERRFRASTQLGLKEVPVEIVGKMTELDRIIKRFHLQEQHKNWTYFDKARAIRAIVETGDLKEKDVAEILGLKSQVVSDLLALLNFSHRSQEIIEIKRIPYGFVMRINRTLNKVQNQNLRPKLETALLNRISNGTIKRPIEIDDYTRSIGKAGDKIARKIINNPKYTSHKALIESKADDLKILASIKGGMGWFNSRANEGVKKQIWRVMDKATLSAMKRIRNQLDKIISKSHPVDNED